MATVSNTLIDGNTLANRVQAGLRIGTTNGDKLTVTTLTVTGNDITNNTQDGIYINTNVTWSTGNVINNNNISGNLVYGINNQGTETIDAESNWWGACTGPDDDGSKNPYYNQAAIAGADNCTTYVDFTPWMIHTSLVSGWNVYSTPIASGTSTDTISEALNFWGTGSATAAYYYDSSASPQIFVIATSLTPLTAVYLDMSSSANISVLMSTSNTAPPSRTMYQGWNLVGPAELYAMDAEDALASAYYVAGANNIGYSQVVSPAVNQAAWSAVRGPAIDTESSKAMTPCEGYWVSMVNQGTLAGFTSTPITPLP